MKLYKLTPVDGPFDGWKYSAFRGDVIVRAENEIEARLLAARGFGKRPPEKVKDGASTNPWGERVAVNVSEITDPRYSTAGLPQVLEPLAY